MYCVSSELCVHRRDYCSQWGNTEDQKTAKQPYNGRHSELILGLFGKGLWVFIKLVMGGRYFTKLCDE